MKCKLLLIALGAVFVVNGALAQQKMKPLTTKQANAYQELTKTLVSKTFAQRIRENRNPDFKTPEQRMAENRITFLKEREKFDREAMMVRSKRVEVKKPGDPGNAEQAEMMAFRHMPIDQELDKGLDKRNILSPEQVQLMRKNPEQFKLQLQQEIRDQIIKGKTSQNGNIRTSEEGLLLLDVLTQEYDFGTAEYVDVKTVKFTYVTVNETYTYEIEIDADGTMGDTLSVVYEKRDPDTGYRISYEKHQLYNGELVLVNKSNLSFYEENGQTYGFYTEYYSAYYYYDWDTDTYYLGYKYEESSDENGNQTKYFSANYDVDGNVTYGYRSLSEYDDNGYMTDNTYENYNTDLGKWVTTYISEYEYDDEGNTLLDSYISYNYDGTYSWSNKDEYAYDAGGDMIMYRYSVYDDVNAKWIVRSYWEDTYDDNGNMTSYVNESYDEEGNQTSGSKTENTYDENDNLLTWTQQRWDSGSGVYFYSYKDEYTYDENGNVTKESGQYFDTESEKWITSWESTYAYDENGNVIEETAYYLDWNNEVVREKIVYEVNEEGDITYAELFYWDDVNEEWFAEAVLRGTWTYTGDSEEILIEEKVGDVWEYAQKMETDVSTDNDGNTVTVWTDSSWDGADWVIEDQDTHIEDPETETTLFHSSYYRDEDTGELVLDYLGEYEIIVIDGEVYYTLSISYDPYWGGNKYVYDYNELGQQTLFEYWYSYDTGPYEEITWVFSNYSKNQWDANGNYVLGEYYYDDGYGYKYVYSYDHPSNPNEQTGYKEYTTEDTDISDGLDWVSNYFWEREYQQFGEDVKLLSYLYYSWGWGYTYGYEYTEDGDLTLYTYADTEDQDPSDGIDWRITSRTTWTYDANGNQIKSVSEYLDYGTNELVNSDKTEQEYNADNQLILSSTYYWDGTAWVKNYSMSYAYNDMNDVLETVYTSYYGDGSEYYKEKKIYNYAESGFSTYCAVTITGDDVLTGSSVTLTASIESGGGTFKWMDSDGIELGTDASITLDQSGMYAVEVFNETCKVTEKAKVYDNCTVTITGEVYLYDDEVTLTASMEGEENAYEWFDSGDVSVGTEAAFTTSTAGEYSVIAMGGFCWGKAETEVLIVTGFEEYVNEGFRMYPNPSTGVINLQLRKLAKENAEIKILNLQGQLIYHQRINSPTEVFEINLSHEREGIYFLLYNSGEQKFVEKFFINK